MAMLSRVGEIVRRHDPDRFLTALFAPAARRETLFVLYAFNHELARARPAVREPMAALIRLQWWREVVEGKRVRHEVAGPLGDALDSGALDAGVLGGMVDAREAEVDGVGDMAGFAAYARGAAGGVMVAAGRALGFEGAEALRDGGAAYGALHVLRGAADQARRGLCLLPGLDPAGVLTGGPAMDRVASEVAALAGTWLSGVPAVQGAGAPAALPLVYARRDVRRRLAALDEPRRRPALDRFAVVLAGLRQRV